MDLQEERPLQLAEAFRVSVRALLGSLRSELGLLGVGRGELAAEAVDTAGCVHELLLAGEEGVAGGADFDDDRALVGGTCVELITAGALDVRFIVLGVNSGLRHVGQIPFERQKQYFVSS